MKFEDNFRTVMIENQELKSKDSTFVSIYECLKNALSLKGLHISGVDKTPSPPSSSYSQPRVEENQQIKFICDQCKVETNTKEELHKHKEIHHLNQCNMCEYKTNDKTLLKEHKKTSHEKVIFAC